MEKCWREALCRSVGKVLEKSVGEKCCRELLEKSVVEKCWGEVL